MSNDNLSELREKFQGLKKCTFFNSAAVTLTADPIKEAVYSWIEQGETAQFKYVDILTRARDSAARLVNGKPYQIFFSKSTTHGLMHFIHGFPWQAGDEIVLADCEFPANRLPWLGLKRMGVNVKLVKTQNYTVSLDELKTACSSNTRVITVSWVQYLSGQRTDLKKLGEFCRERDIFLVVDAIQGLGIVPMDAPAWNIDWISADGHKWLCAPEGIGLGWASERALKTVIPPYKGWLAVKKPFEFDAPDQELTDDAFKYNDGSPNLIGIMALTAALDMLQETGIKRIHNHILDLTDYVLAELNNRSWLCLTPQNRHERAGIVSFKIPGKDSQVLWEHLKQADIICSVRSGWLRLALHGFNTHSDITTLFTTLNSFSS